jgi:hypothetical protein
VPNLSFDAHADGALETGVEIWVSRHSIMYLYVRACVFKWACLSAPSSGKEACVCEHIYLSEREFLEREREDEEAEKDEEEE